MAEQSDYSAPRGRRISVVSHAAVASLYADYQPGVDDTPLVEALQVRLDAAFGAVA